MDFDHGAPAFDSDSDASGLVTSVPGPTGTLSFSETVAHCRIGGCWGAFANGYTGSVYATNPSRHRLTLAITLPADTGAFYLYVDPNNGETPHQITATATNPSQTITKSSGPIDVINPFTSTAWDQAQYFGFYGVGGATIRTITVTASPGAGAMAMGEFGIAKS
jgi:hypothetical protein